MKTNTIAIMAVISLLPLTGFSQNSPMPVPPVPPVPAVPPVPPVPNSGRDRDRDKLPKVPVTYLGVETSDVPSVVAEQLGLAKGFGLVVDYVVPDGPAAAAGVQANDILKMMNDQILTEPDQLAKLIRSYNEGTSVTLTVLRKGAETKLTAKLAKREVSQRRGMMPGWDRHRKNGQGFGGLGPEFEREMKELGEELGNMKFGMIDGAVTNAREEVRRAREEARRDAEEARRDAEEARREAQQVARDAQTGRGVRVVTSNENGAMKTTRIDLARAQITYTDAQGEMRIETVNDKKVLTAKDPQGRLLFSGPVGTKEELDKVPAEVRQRYDKLEQKDLPAVAPKVTRDEEEGEADEDDDSDNEDVENVVQVSTCPAPQSFPYRRLGINTVLI